MSLKLIAGPSIEPITTDEAKAHLRVTGSAEDAYVASLVTAARMQAEAFAGRAFLVQTWEYALDATELGGADTDLVKLRMNWPVSAPLSGIDPLVELPRPPLRSVTWIKSYTSANEESTFAASNYTVDTRSEPGRVVLNRGAVWPTDLRSYDALVVRYEAGYGETAADVPQDVRQAVLIMVADFYEHRQSIYVGTSAVSIPQAARSLLLPYRVVRL